MPDAYTKINKPSDASYTNVNPEGKQAYNDSSVSYNDSTVYYNSINPNAYTMVAKPINADIPWDSFTVSWQSANITWDTGSGYTNIAKPTT